MTQGWVVLSCKEAPMTHGRVIKAARMHEGLRFIAPDFRTFVRGVLAV